MIYDHQVAAEFISTELNKVGHRVNVDELLQIMPELDELLDGCRQVDFYDQKDRAMEAAKAKENQMKMACERAEIHWSEARRYTIFADNRITISDF